MNNKGSDKNVVTEDVNELKRLLYSDNLTQYGKRKLVSYYDKRIQELEKEKVELKEYNKIVSDRIVEYKKNSIPTQVVIDKMEELNKEIKKCDEIDAIFKIKQQQILQELLGGERK